MPVAETVVEFSLSITLKAEYADRLIEAAEMRERSPASVMAELIEIVLKDDLIDALLDDAP